MKNNMEGLGGVSSGQKTPESGKLNERVKSLKGYLQGSLLTMAVLISTTEKGTTQSAPEIQKDKELTGITDGYAYRTIGRGDNLKEHAISGLAPFALGFQIAEKISEDIEIDIPFTYAKQFKGTETTEEGAQRQKELQEYLGNKLREKLANSFGGVGYESVDKWLEKAFREAYPEESKELDNFSDIKIKKILIKGQASPEARIHGLGSIAPGHADQENKEVAMRRAKDKALIDALESLGVHMDKDAQVAYESEEVQFSDQDIKDLMGLGQELGMLLRERSS